MNLKLYIKWYPFYALHYSYIYNIGRKNHWNKIVLVFGTEHRLFLQLAWFIRYIYYWNLKVLNNVNYVLLTQTLVTVADIQVTVADIQVTVADIQVTVADIQVTVADIQVTVADIQSHVYTLKVSCLEYLAF